MAYKYREYIEGNFDKVETNITFLHFENIKILTKCSMKRLIKVLQSATHIKGLILKHAVFNTEFDLSLLMETLINYNYNLKYLVLPCQMTIQQYKTVANHIKQIKKLRKLKLICTHSVAHDIDGIDYLLKGLTYNSTIKKLKIEQLYSENINTLLLSMAKNNALETIDISLADFRYIQPGSLQLNRNLKKLKMCSISNLNSEHIKNLSESLNNSTLEFLNLNYCHIDCDSCILLFRALAYNKTIKTVILEGNDINDKGVISISDTLKINSTINYLNIKVNRHNSESEDILFQTVELCDNSICKLYTNNYPYNYWSSTRALGSIKNRLQAKLKQNSLRTKTLAYLCVHIINKNKIKIPENYPKLIIKQNKDWIYSPYK